MIRWRSKEGLRPRRASLPCDEDARGRARAHRLDDDTLRILFGARDEANRSRIGWIDVNPLDRQHPPGRRREPPMELGRAGHLR